MRLLIVINSLAMGGAEKLILDTIPKFLEAGITVELALLNGRETPFLKQLETYPDLSIHKLSQGSVYHHKHIVTLYRFIKRFDIIHVHLFPGLYWMALAKWFSGKRVPLVFTEHNTTNRRSHFLFKMMDRWVYKKYDQLIAISKPVQDALLLKFPFLAAKTALIPNGISLDKIENAIPAKRTEFQLTNEDVLLIQVSSFTPQKDQDTLIKSLVQLPSNVHLLLVGEGPRLATCKSLVSKLKLDARVQFLGIRMDVPSLLKMADIVVLSSHFEGLSLSSMEGMASGNPFVASDVPGLTSVVEGAGILFPLGDAETLATHLKKLIDQPDYRERIKNQCLKRAQNYKLETMVDTHVELYRKLCQKENW